MSATTRTKDSFHTVRFDPARKGQIGVAASLTGLSVGAFIRDAAEKAARQVLLEELQREAETTGAPA